MGVNWHTAWGGTSIRLLDILDLEVGACLGVWHGREKRQGGRGVRGVREDWNRGKGEKREAQC